MNPCFKYFSIYLLLISLCAIILVSVSTLVWYKQDVYCTTTWNTTSRKCGTRDVLISESPIFVLVCILSFPVMTILYGIIILLFL